jgi:hypothetical protein
MNETLEEAAERIVREWYGSGEDQCEDCFIKGAKWQQEQDKNKYSDSDMTNYALYILHNDVITPKQWFEQFKKK